MRALAALAIFLAACSTGGASPDAPPAAAAEQPAGVSPSELVGARICGRNCEFGATRSCVDESGQPATQVCTPDGLAWFDCGEEGDKAAPSLCAEDEGCWRKVGGVGSGYLTCQCDPAKREGGCPEAEEP